MPSGHDASCYLTDVCHNFQRLFSLRVGQTLRGAVRSRPLAIEYEVLARPCGRHHHVREKGDATTANIFETVLKGQGEPYRLPRDAAGIDEQLGVEALLAQCVSRPPSGGSG